MKLNMNSLMGSRNTTTSKLFANSSLAKQTSLAKNTSKTKSKSSGVKLSLSGNKPTNKKDPVKELQKKKSLLAKQKAKIVTQARKSGEDQAVTKVKLASIEAQMKYIDSQIKQESMKNIKKAK